jgi:ABC-2 type transport system permease protein
MSGLADASLAVLKRDWLIFISYRARFVTQAISLFFNVTLFYYISRLVRVGTFNSPDDYFAFAIIGLIALQVITSTLYTPPTSLQGELIAGTFERLVLSPLGAVAGIVSMMLFPFVYSLLSALVMLAFGALVFELPVEWSTAALALPVAVLGTVAFASFGVVLVGLVLVVKQVTTGTTWIVAGISLIAGLYFPVALLPDWIEWASEVQPFTPAVDLLRNVLVGTPLEDPALLNAAKIAAFAAVLMPLSVWVLSATVRVSRRRGTILEY